MNKKIYLSYDLSLQGDYNNLYKWLEEHSARECGDSFCMFNYDFKSIEENINDKSSLAMLNELRQDLNEKVKFSNSDRVYMVADMFYKDSVKIVGAWVIGKRKANNPWDGFGGQAESDIKLDD